MAKNTKEDFITYLKTLKPSDWEVKVNNNWTVKDLVAHMVGWEKIDSEIIKETWQTKRRPWFYETDDFDGFNMKNVEFYKSYTPNQLIKEWEMWQELSQDEINRIEEDRLRSYPKLFGWLFGLDNYISHYSKHFNQIRKVLEKKNENRNHASKTNPIFQL